MIITMISKEMMLTYPFNVNRFSFPMPSAG